jgi:small subunit ribosomal protein S17
MTEQVNERNLRKKVSGVVTAVSGDKTIKVTFFYKIPHPLYKKEIKRKTVVFAHDEEHEASIGDEVEVMETRPLSKIKRYRLVKILKKAPVQETETKKIG